VVRRRRSDHGCRDGQPQSFLIANVPTATGVCEAVLVDALDLAPTGRPGDASTGLMKVGKRVRCAQRTGGVDDPIRRTLMAGRTEGTHRPTPLHHQRGVGQGASPQLVALAELLFVVTTARGRPAGATLRTGLPPLRLGTSVGKDHPTCHGLSTGLPIVRRVAKSWSACAPYSQPTCLLKRTSATIHAHPSAVPWCPTLPADEDTLRKPEAASVGRR
jgi:hypothetical protein